MFYLKFLEEIKKSGLFSSLDEVQTVKFSLPRRFKGYDCAIRLSCVDNSLTEKIPSLPYFITDYVRIGNYINFVLEKKCFSEWCWELLNDILSDNYKLQERNVVVEHTSLTPAYPLNIATFRSSVIGDALVRGFRHITKNVSADYFVEDTARQLNWIPILFDEGKIKSTGSKIDHCYGRVFAEQCKENKNLPLSLNDIKEMFPYGEYEVNNCRLNVFVDKKSVSRSCLQGNLESLREAGIHFDLFHYESNIIGDGNENISYVQKNAELYKRLADISTKVYTVVPGTQSTKIVKAIKWYKLSKSIKPIYFGNVYFEKDGMLQTDKISEGRFHSIDAIVKEIGQHYHMNKDASFNTLKLILLKYNRIEKVVFHPLGDDQYKCYQRLCERLKNIHDWIIRETEEKFGNEIYTLSKKCMIAYSRYTKDFLEDAEFDNWINCLSEIEDCIIRCKEKHQYNNSIMNSAYSFLIWGYTMIGIEIVEF